MSAAPTDGTVIEALHDGDWYPVYWSDSAVDMSPYGCEGWAHEPDRLLMVDLEGWRELPDDEARAVDELAQRLSEADEREQARIAGEAAERSRVNAAQRQRTRETREQLEARYERLTGEQPPKMWVAQLRREVSQRQAAQSLADLARLIGTLPRH